MGADQLAFNPSLRSLTHALGLDDDSIEEVLTPSSFRSKSTGRPPSIASSIGGYDWTPGLPQNASRARSTSRSPYMSTMAVPQDTEKGASDADLRHLNCLQCCQVTGSNTCSSASAVALDKPYDSSCDDLSVTSSLSNLHLHRTSTLRSQSVYLEPTKRHTRNQSSCSLLKLTSKVLPFGSRRDVSTPSKVAWPPSTPDVTIKENAAHAAINAGLSGLPFADLVFVSATDGWETHVHSYILSSVCPLLLQKIRADNTLDLDIDRTRQSSVSICSQTKPSSRSKWTKPKSWWRGGAKRSKKPADETSPSGKSKTDSMASESTLSVDDVPRLYESTTCFTRPRRVQVTGCNGPDLRAFCFYLYTNQFRLVSSHGVEGVDDSSAFRGHAKGSSSTSTSDSDETAWDPIRIRKSRSLHDVFWPEKGAGLRARRSSTHTLLSLNSAGVAPHLATTPSTLPRRPVQDGNFPHSPSQPPPFSVQGAYHLSQLFNLTHLACASSSFFFHRLTLTNALQYYISPFSIAYPSIQSGCLDYLVRHWSQVSTQTQSQTILGRLAAGWYPQANMALLQLLGKVE